MCHGGGGGFCLGVFLLVGGIEGGVPLASGNCCGGGLSVWGCGPGEHGIYQSLNFKLRGMGLGKICLNT